MAERKVLVKYYPPDFDSDLLYKNKRSRDKQDNVRMMLPMSLQCITCGVYLYIGSKFNMRKETILDDNYLGLQMFRFYLKCYACYSEITFKTDPKNHDYIVEGGGRRNYEPWRDINAAQEKLGQLKMLEEEGNTMKFLENKTFDSKREMDILDALDEIRNSNKRNSQVTVDDLFLQFYKNQNSYNDNQIEQIYDKISQKVFEQKRRLELKEEEELQKFNLETLQNSHQSPSQQQQSLQQNQKEQQQVQPSETIKIFYNDKKISQNNTKRVFFKINKKEDQTKNTTQPIKQANKLQIKLLDYSDDD